MAGDEDGNPVLSQYHLGKGWVFFCNFPMESYLTKQGEGFTRERYPYYRIYQKVAKTLLDAKPLSCDSPNVGITLHPLDEHTDIAIILNYSNQPIAPKYKAKGVLKQIYGSPDLLPPCSGCICYLKK